jgi:ABC-type nitrate/sulfonate/bicarbonate transport system substrate-binding protein
MTIIAVILLIVGLLQIQKRKSVSKEIVIRVADTTTTPNGWDLVTKLTGRDILKEEGVKVQLVPGISGVGPRFQALLTGQLDLETGAWVGWVNVVARGGKIKAVYSPGAVYKGLIGRSGILVLENSEIRSIKDLKGKTIAVNTLGLAGEYVIKVMLQKNGLHPADIQLLSVPDANEEQVLRTKQVDAVAGTTNGGTWFDLARERGGVRIVPGTSEYDAYGHDATTMGGGFREDFIQAHPDVVRQYVMAIEKAKRIIWDEFQKNPERVRTVYAEISQEKGGNPDLGKYYFPLPPDSTLIKDKDIQFWIDALVEEGQLKPGQIKPSDIYTNEFNSFMNEPASKKLH